MNDPTSLTKSELLSISRPEQLFPGNLDSLKRVFRSLSRKWHPDMPSGDTEVFAKISTLNELAEKKLVTGHWDGAGVVTIETRTSGIVHIHAQTSGDFVLGRQIITGNRLFYAVDPAHKSFVDTFTSVRRHFRYSSDNMRRECERYVPGTITVDLLKDGRQLVSLPKTTDLIRLSDVVKHHGGELDAKSGAWIISSLMNLCCYLEYTHVVHGDISADNYFISPEYHNGALLGGWWFATTVGSIVKTLPRRTMDIAPYEIKVNKQATPLIDLELVKLLGRECLSLNTATPPIKKWLTSIATGSARDQYASWMKALESFGPRRFIKMSVTAEEIYGS